MSIYYERKIHKELKAHLQDRQVTILTGMRRTGKTTLVNILLGEINSQNKIFLDFQNIVDREIFKNKDYNNILRTLETRGLDLGKKMYIAVDEIQLVPDSPSAVKYLYDHFDIKFILTGSSSYYLKNLFTESLAGRKRLFELSPLDFGEFLDFKKVKYVASGGGIFEKSFNLDEYERLKIYYEEYIKFGGFPEVVLAKSAEKKTRLLEDILSSYINIDIKALSDFKENTDLINLIKMLATRAGTRLEILKISNLTGLARQTVQNYINLFESTYLIYTLPVFTKSPDREVVKAKKFYFGDNGLLSILADIGGGKMFENSVFNQMGKICKLNYYALKNGKEIDFVMDKKLALETKETPTTEDLRNLENISRTAGLDNHKLIGRHKSPKFNNYIWGGSIR